MKSVGNNWYSIGKLVFIFLIGTVLLAGGVGAITLTPQDAGSSTTTGIAKGDTVHITGIATGHPQAAGLQVWVIGNNYLKVSTISVNSDNSYDYEMAKADTTNLASGQYFVLIQHPMMNGQFDIVYDPGSGQVSNLQLGSGSAIFKMSGSGSLQSTNSASALVAAITNQNVDDTFVTYSLFVDDPTTPINPIGDRVVGDKFTISGTTNLAVGDQLLVEITSASFQPTSKTRDSAFSGASGQVTVVPGTGGRNRWSFDVDTSTFKPDMYIVQLTGITNKVTGSTTFNLLAEPVATIATVPLQTIATTQPFTAATSVPTTMPTTKKTPALLFTGIAALGIVIVMKRR